MTTLRLAEELRDYLATHGVVRASVSAGGALPPMWISPARGVPAPGDGAGPEMHPSLVLGLYHAPGVPTDSYEGFWERRSMDIWVRSKTASAAEDIWRNQLLPLLDDKQQIMLDQLRVQEILMVRDLQLLSSDGESGYTYVAQFSFAVRRADYVV